MLKNLLMMLIDFLCVAIGVVLLPLGLLRWKNAGFIIERLSEPSLFEGHASIMLMLFGLGLISYGIVDFWIFG